MKVLATSFAFFVLSFHSAKVEAKLGSPSNGVTSETSDQGLPSVVVVPREFRGLNDLVGFGADPPSRFIPLGLCEGDCDNDAQCDPGLKCFQRDAYDPVPGCAGGENFGSGTDFCIKAGGGGGSNPSPTPPAPQLTWGGGGGGGLARCQGDCDRDTDCQGNLVCHQRSRGDPLPQQCPNRPTNNQKDYCVDPSGGQPSPTLPSPTPPAPTPPVPTPPAPTPPSPTNPSPTHPSPTNPSPTPPIVYTGKGFGPCGGDCDKDSDCKNGLICNQRDRGDPIPAGCSGNVNGQKDFCIDPHNLHREVDPDTLPYTPKFRLKLYWQEGYMWQDESFERKWCVMRDYRGQPGTGKCWYGLDSLSCNPEHTYTAKCNNDERQEWQFEYVNDSEAIIKVPGENRCMMRQGIEIVLRPCNSANHLQRFFAIRGGLEDYRFELSQKTATRFCLNQAHHPKPGEVIAMYPCARTRSPDHMTSWWEKY